MPKFFQKIEVGLNLVGSFNIHEQIHNRHNKLALQKDPHNKQEDRY